MWLSVSVRFRAIVRMAAVPVALASLLVLPGCWVQSINGLSEAEFVGSDKDQVYDPGLLGAWTVTSEEHGVTTLNVTASGKDYHWQMTGVGEDCDKDRGDAAYYGAELFKLDDYKFLDLTARSSDVCHACIAVHWIFKVDVEKDSFSLAPVDSDWLEKAEREKTVTLATAQGNYDTLTASPKELKAFCRKYAGDKDVFKPAPDYVFKRK